MKWIFLGVLLLCVSFPIFQVEEHRFQECYSKCSKKALRNQLLLASDVCTDEFLKFELDGDQVRCSEAQKENELGVFRCAATAWWREGEVAALYSRVFESTMMMYAIILPCLLYGIYHIAAYYTDKRRENKWFSERTKFTEKLLRNQPPKYIKDKPAYVSSNTNKERRRLKRKKRKEYYLE